LKLTKALSPLNLADTCDVTLSPDFTVTICQAALHNQVYHARVAAYATANPDHPARDAKSQFWTDMFAGKLTPDTLAFLTNVVIVDWLLADDDGELVPYTPETAAEVLSTDQVGKVVASRILQACLGSKLFEVSLKL